MEGKLWGRAGASMISSCQAPQTAMCSKSWRHPKPLLLGFPEVFIRASQVVLVVMNLPANAYLVVHFLLHHLTFGLLGVLSSLQKIQRGIFKK